MRSTKFLYTALGLLSLFVFSVLVTHWATLPSRNRVSFREASLPFGYVNRVTSIKPEGEAAGIRIGDRVETVNGNLIATEQEWIDMLVGLKRDETVTLGVVRSTDGAEERFQTQVSTIPAARNAAFFAGFITSFLYTFAIPTISILLAFWVAFLRPKDPLAWVLLLVLLGMSSISFEGYPSNTLIGAYRSFFYSSWALGMLLFGIYFPERWTFDIRRPWFKWILIVPLLFQILLALLNRSSILFGFNPVDYIRPIADAYDVIGFFVNLVAISLFFAIFGHKAGTLENPDSRRRISLLVWGTGFGMGPTFLVVLYKALTGSGGSFFDSVPFWIAIVTLLSLNLFPLTLAYVIVVQQAMEVRVIVRQGLQYALAKGGVRVLQFFLLLGIGLGVRWSINNYGGSFATQFAFIIGGIALVPLIEVIAKPIRVWIDKRFFRDAYNAEQILLELSEDVRTMVETKPLLETVSEKISESLHVPQVALLLRKGNGFEPAYAIGYDTPPLAHISEDAKAVQTLKRNQYLMIYDEYRETTSTPQITFDEKRQIEELNSQLLLPVAAKNRLSGIISLSAKRSEEPYSANDIRMLRSVATQTGLALENSRLTEAIASEAAQKERLNRELEIAREVQERLFPQEMPKIEGIEYYGACRPALGVGGDYYDFFELEGGKYGFAIGDVSGKGIGASLMMASLQASLRGQAIHSGDNLAELMRNVNRLVYETSTANRYATFFYGQFDPRDRKFTYVNAGHNPPFLLRKGLDEPILLDQGGPVVGMLPPMLVSYTQGEVTLQPGDLIAGFTDGISEAMNPEDVEWGEPAVLNELWKIADLDPKAILNHVVAAADTFANGAQQHDDMTMIVIKCVCEA